MQYIESFPVSLFTDVRKNTPEATVDLAFEDFVEVLREMSAEPRSGKEAAPLFSSTRFKNDRRSKANVTLSGMVVLDIDFGQTIEETIIRLGRYQVAGLVYSTASHRDDLHKFRLCIPLHQPVDADTYGRCWHALNLAFTDGSADPSKIGMESLFYLPGTYPSAPTVFTFCDGAILNAEQWIDDVEASGWAEAHPVKVAGQRTTRLQDRFQSSYLSHANRISRPGATRMPSDRDLNLYDTPLITSRAREEYQSSFGSFHHARFRLMLSIAGRAKKLGIAISTGDVVTLFNQVDLIDGGHYQSHEYQREIRNDAAKAVQEAR